MVAEHAPYPRPHSPLNQKRVLDAQHTFVYLNDQLKKAYSGENDQWQARWNRWRRTNTRLSTLLNIPPFGEEHDQAVDVMRKHLKDNKINATLSPLTRGESRIPDGHRPTRTPRFGGWKPRRVSTPPPIFKDTPAGIQIGWNI